jgi:hypothetical protein
LPKKLAARVKRSAEQVGESALEFVKKAIDLRERVIKIAGRNPTKEARDEALQKLVPEEDQRQLFRGVMSALAKRTAVIMSVEERHARAKKAAEARWEKERRKRAREKKDKT